MSRFPEFVFSWLNTYEYNKATQSIHNISDYDDSNIYKLNLFLEKNKDKIWVHR